jgi:DNA-binding transcriptional MerR regulator
MPDPHPSSSLPAKALREFKKAVDADWQKGISLTALLDRINNLAVQLVPEENENHSRVKRTFTERSFRHYQTLGCIDSPEKTGNRGLYGVRHFVQALLVRKLLWERVSSEQITALIAGRGVEETKRMFLGGIQMVAKPEENHGAKAAESLAPKAAEIWKRIEVAPGIELNVRNDMSKPKPAELKKIMERCEWALRGGG